MSALAQFYFALDADNKDLVVDLLKQSDLKKSDFEEFFHLATGSKKFDVIPLLLNRWPLSDFSNCTRGVYQIICAERFDILQLLIKRQSSDYSVLAEWFEMFLKNSSCYNHPIVEHMQIFYFSNRHVELVRSFMQVLYCPVQLDQFLARAWRISAADMHDSNIETTNFFTKILYNHFNYNLQTWQIMARTKRQLHLGIYKHTLTELGIGLQELRLPRLLLCHLTQYCSDPFGNIAEMSDMWTLFENIN